MNYQIGDKVRMVRMPIDILAVEYETKLANKAREVIKEEDNK